MVVAIVAVSAAIRVAKKNVMCHGSIFYVALPLAVAAAVAVCKPLDVDVAVNLAGVAGQVAAAVIRG